MDERGVSDVLAFALTFAIIITGVGLVSLVALDPLAAFSDNQEVVKRLGVKPRGFLFLRQNLQEQYLDDTVSQRLQSPQA